jgi:hypothetical protein
LTAVAVQAREDRGAPALAVNAPCTSRPARIPIRLILRPQCGGMEHALENL